MRHTIFRIGVLLALIALSGCKTSEPAPDTAPDDAVEQPDETAPAEEASADGDMGTEYDATSLMSALQAKSPALQLGVVSALGTAQVPMNDTESVWMLERGNGTVLLTLMFPEGFVHQALGPQEPVQKLDCTPGDGDTWSCEMTE